MRAMIAELVARGYSESVAGEYASRLGDIIEEENGKWIIRDDKNEIIDRIDPIFEDDDSSDEDDE